MCTNEVEQNPVYNGPEKLKISVASWIDLLGYGRQISDANFNPTDPEAYEPHSRLVDFRKIVSEYAEKKDLKTLVLNDGAVAYQDLTCSSHDTFSFFKKSWKLYKK